MSDVIGSTTEAAKAKAAQARADLATTLDAIEDKLNVPKRVSASYQKRPLPWVVAGGAAVAVVLGLVAWAIFRDD